MLRFPLWAKTHLLVVDIAQQHMRYKVARAALRGGAPQQLLAGPLHIAGKVRALAWKRVITTEEWEVVQDGAYRWARVAMKAAITTTKTAVPRALHAKYQSPEDLDTACTVHATAWVQLTCDVARAVLAHSQPAGKSPPRASTSRAPPPQSLTPSVRSLAYPRRCVPLAHVEKEVAGGQKGQHEPRQAARQGGGPG